MVAARVSFGPLSPDPDERERQIDLADGYLAMLFKNGQAGPDQIDARENGQHVVYTALTQPDAHEDRFCSEWSRRDREKVTEAFGHPPRWTLLDDDPEAFAKADWQGAPSLVVCTRWAFENDLIGRGDDGEELAIYLLPVSDQTREHLVHWGMHYRELDLVWLGSGDLEIPAYKQLVEPDSTLMEDGRRLAREVETATSLPTYMYLQRYYGRRTNEEARLCPGCGEAWYVGGDREGGYLEGFAFRCDACRLVSEMPSDTSDERHARLGEYRAPRS
ncbi:MAG: DUF2310 family Zn-ribbon-containing protein [Bacteroidota bacterium]